jgi:hypothetical protein
VHRARLMPARELTLGTVRGSEDECLSRPGRSESRCSKSNPEDLGSPTGALVTPSGFAAGPQ